MMAEEDPETYYRLFNDKLRKYEDMLVEFLLDIAKSKKVIPKISKISSYLLIHGKLTQKELKVLTGFSMGSISTLLSIMTGTGVYKKERIPKTHTYMYVFSGNLEDLTTKGLEIALRSFSSFGIYLKSKKEELKVLIKQNKKGAEHLSQRIDELLEAFEFYKILYQVMMKNTLEETQKEVSLETFRIIKKEKKDVRRIPFDEDVYLIESDMLNQLAASPMFSSRDPMFIRILGYFITRTYLTQKTLQRITGLSAGKISEEVNMLLENGLIEKSDISPKGKITYGAESAGITLLKFTRAVISRMAKWDVELHKMRSELEENRNDLKTLNGYERIYKIFEYLLDSISKYKIFIDMIDKILKV